MGMIHSVKYVRYFLLSSYFVSIFLLVGNNIFIEPIKALKFYVNIQRRQVPGMR